MLKLFNCLLVPSQLHKYFYRFSLRNIILLHFIVRDIFFFLFGIIHKHIYANFVFLTRT